MSRDTLPAAELHFLKLMTAKTNEERLRMGCSMFDASRKLVTAGILSRKPGISKRQLRKELFLKFYGSDFPKKEKEKILKGLD